MRLEIGLAGRVEVWKATRWAAKLEQLKTQNDSLVSGLRWEAVQCRTVDGVRRMLRDSSTVHCKARALRLALSGSP